jgi:predicted ATPase
MARLDRLGVGKDIAQWASVLGRDFSYEVLETVAPYDAEVLQAGLDQLVEAGLVFRRGLLAQAHYRFKHVLVQEAAYDSLLRRQRQAMHHRIAQVLETQFAELVRTEPEVIARHYTEADLPEQAIPYWQRAGESYAKRSAHQEAINHLQTGLALLDRLPDTPYRAQQKLALLLTLGPVLRATQGQMGRAFSDTYERALALCQQLGDTRNLFPVLYGLQRTYLLRPDLQRAREVGEELVIEAERSQEIGLQIVAHLAFGSTLFYVGEFCLAMEHTNQGVTLYDPQRHHNLSVRYGGANPRVSCLIHTARSLVALGYPDQALHHIQTACTQARGLSHAFTLVHALLFAGILHQARREPQRLQEHAEAVVELSTTQGFAYHLATGKILLGWALSAQAKTAEGLACVREGLAMLDTREGMLTVPYWLSLQAEVYGHSRQAEEGLRLLDEGLTLVHQHHNRYHEAELYRLKGELIQQATVEWQQTHVTPERCFEVALDIARQQQAKFLELRAAISLVRLWQSQGKRQDAYGLLAPVYDWFTEGFDTADLQDAKALLQELDE